MLAPLNHHFKIHAGGGVFLEKSLTNYPQWHIFQIINKKQQLTNN